MQKITDLTAEINRQKQANQVAYSHERARRIQELERETINLNEQIRVQSQSQQKPAFVSGQTQTGTQTRLVTLHTHDTKAAAEHFAPHSFMAGQNERTKN